MVVVITMTNSQAAFQHIEKMLILTCICNLLQAISLKVNEKKNVDHGNILHFMLMDQVILVYSSNPIISKWMKLHIKDG